MRISDWSSDVCSSDLESSRSGFSRELSSAWQTASRILKQETIAQKETPQPRLRGFGVKTLAMTYSRMLGAHYHRRVRVSLPSSGWDRVVPRSYCHQRSEEHTSELQSLMRISYAVFCLKKKKKTY